MWGWLARFWERRFPRSLGARGEKLAAQYARRTLGFGILARNVLCPKGELDIVALDGKHIVFIEVRTRATEVFGTPEGSIGFKKRKALARAARWYMRSRGVKGLVPRFDVIAVVWEKDGKPVVRHWRGVFGLGS